MTDYPLRYTVGLHRYVEGDVNAHGKVVKEYQPPKDQAGLQVRVVQWVPTQFGVPEPEVDTTMHWLELFVPEVLTDVDGNTVDDIGAFDLVDLPEGQYEVDGPVWDYSKGFHGWSAGKVVRLKRRVG